MTFANGNSTGDTYEGGGGGAIFARGGRLKIIRSRFVRNRATRPARTWAAPPCGRCRQHHNQPVNVVRSTFGARGLQRTAPR